MHPLSLRFVVQLFTAAPPVTRDYLATCHMTTCHLTTCPLTRPSAVPGAEDAVVTRVKGYIDAGTCGSVTFTAYSAAECGDNAASYYREFEYGGKRVQVTNNVSTQIFSTKIK